MNASSNVSVIIPVFNGELYIANALDSALAQTWAPREIIIVDDGSTDGTAKVLERYRGKITVLKTANRGVSHARNEGIRIAEGRYIAFLDHDDVWFKRKLEKQIGALLKFPEAGFVACNYFVRYGRFKNRLVRHYSTLQNYAKLNFNSPLRQNAFKILMEENFVGTPSMVLMKRETALRVGNFDLDYKVGEDLDYFLRAALITNFVLLSEPMSYKRTHGGNVTNDLIRFYGGHKEVLIRTMEARRATIDATDLSPVCGLALAKTSYHLGNAYFEQGFRAAAFRHYFQALQYSGSRESLKIFLFTLFKKGTRLLTLDRFTARFKGLLPQT